MSEAENLLWSIRAAGWQEPDAPRILDFGCGDESQPLCLVKQPRHRCNDASRGA